MTFRLRRLAAALAVLAGVTVPAVSEPIEITIHGGATLGVFQTGDRKMDFELSKCGDGEELCVRLLVARGSAKTKQTRPYIGRLVVKEARPSGSNAWKGRLKFGKYDLNGSMKLRPGKDFVVSGCLYLVVCDEITLYAER